MIVMDFLHRCRLMIITISFLYAVTTSSGDTIRVTVKEGKLSGAKFLSRNGNRYYGFLSIPYAKPPVNHLRFQAPVEPEPWSGIRDATKDPPMCVQSNFNRTAINGQEDCLYLNVFSRRLNDISAPVLVFIHGGGFIVGSSAEHSPYYLMDEDNYFVYVSVNYRLGVLGFLSSGDKFLPGNYGMKDQSMALKWIRRNIGSFGGNPANVLIFGQSAGAASVHLHMYSPLSRGLFQKAVTFSGNALNFWSVTLPRIADDHFKMISLVTGCVWSSNSEVVECLKSIPIDDLMRIINNLYIWEPKFGLEFGPTIEQRTIAGAFLTRRPQPGTEFDRIPWMAGITSAEGIYAIADLIKDDGAPLEDLNRNLLKLLPLIAAYATSINDISSCVNFTESLKKIYFDDDDISLKNIDQLVNLTSDTYFGFGTVNAAVKYRGRRYLYYNSYKSYSVMNPPFDERLYRLGVCHGEDMAHYFEYYAKEFGYGNVTDSRDLRVSEELIKMLVTFASTGDPNYINSTFNWKPIDHKLRPYLHISNEGFLVESNFFEKKLLLWNNVSPYKQENGMITNK